MKKLLFSTAIAGITAFSGIAYAGGSGGGHGGVTTTPGAGVTVTVGGFIDVQAAMTDQDSNAEVAGTGATRANHITTDTEIHLRAQGTSDNGITYGGVIELEADIDRDSNHEDKSGGNADKSYIFLESNIGRAELGNNTGAQGAMKVDASTIARGVGGIDGTWYHYVDTDGVAAGAAASTTGMFIITPDLPTDHGPIGGHPGDIEDATKVTLYTPRLHGLQGGVSFTPDQGDHGTASGLSSDTGADQENVIGLGVNYDGDYDGLGVQASVTGEFGSAETATTEDLFAWAVGLGVSFEGFSVAGSWSDWGDSGLATTATSDDQNFWTLGAAYEHGPFGISATYMNSEATDGTNTDEFSNLVFSADYHLAPGFMPYVEVALFDLDEGAVATDNDGSIIMFGTELHF